MTDLSESKSLVYKAKHKIRFVTAASLFDGHDASINIMRRILQASGAEVIHLGHNRSVEEVVSAALEEDAQGVAVSSYQGGTETTGEVRITTDVSKPMAGKHLLLVEDIIDTGLTMKFLLENLKARKPASIKIASLLGKPSRARTKIEIDYKGFVIDDVFVVGYGLDYAEKYRNLPHIAVMDEA